MVELNREFLIKEYGSEDNLLELTRANLGQKEITKIGPNSFLNNNLKRIDANTFKGLDKLEGLFMNHIEIEEIDSRLFESLSNLKVLDLGNNNKIKRINANSFKGLTKLERIELWNNQRKHC